VGCRYLESRKMKLQATKSNYSFKADGFAAA
jgi:hypothetical protein